MWMTGFLFWKKTPGRFFGPAAVETDPKGPKKQPDPDARKTELRTAYEHHNTTETLNDYPEMKPVYPYMAIAQQFVSDSQTLIHDNPRKNHEEYDQHPFPPTGQYLSPDPG